MKERVKTIMRYNLHIIDADKCNCNGIPELDAVDCKPKGLVSFNYARSMTPEAKRDMCCHFFVDDSQFERVWTRPEDNIDRLVDFDCVMTPDFSLFVDMPEPMQRWNVYRQRVLGAWWQRQGIKVVPTLTWGLPRSYDFAFDGLPRGGTVAVSTVGVMRGGDAMDLWRDGMREAIDRLQPRRILLHGMLPDFDFGCEVMSYGHDAVERMHDGR